MISCKMFLLLLETTGLCVLQEIHVSSSISIHAESHSSGLISILEADRTPNVCPRHFLNANLHHQAALAVAVPATDLFRHRLPLDPAPPGDFLTSYIAELAASGSSMERAQIDALRALYGLDQPMYLNISNGWGES